jgi:hypothetical protein
VTAVEFGSAWDQLGDPTPDGSYPVAGIDGCAYVARQETRHGELVWTIARASHYGPERVTSCATLKGSVQRLNAFHVAEICDHCQHVNSHRGHGCEACGRIRYALRYA